VYQFRQDENEYCNKRFVVDDVVRRREGLDPRFDADGSRREAQRDCRGVSRGAEVGERALVLFQIASEESANASDLSAQHRAANDETGR
jgi:hypothetical protein